MDLATIRVIVEDFSIRRIVEAIWAGRVRIPAFQRGFVWDADLVAHLMDSLYKGYPVGAVLLWRTKNQLKSERRLGPFELPDRDPDYPIDYVLDGQQRLTSIFGVFQTEVPADPPTRPFAVYFDLAADPNPQESQFVALEPSQVIHGQHFPLMCLFDPGGFHRTVDGWPDSARDRIYELQARFQEVKVPVQFLETDERARVAIVFERINRMGVELDTLQLLTAWTWSEEFDLQQEFRDLADVLNSFGFGAVGEDTNLILRCCAAVVAGDASPEALMGLNGVDVRNRFDEITNGIKGAIDFVRQNLNVYSLKNLPYSTLLVPLSAFFAVAGTGGVGYTASQRDQLIKWFWRSCISRRYSSGVLRSLNADIAAAKSLRADAGVSDLGEFTTSVSTDFFKSNAFSIGSVNTKTFILLLAQEAPRSFVSGTLVSLDRVLKDYNRNEFHHLYPQSYLKAKGFDGPRIQCLANFAFLSSQDNKTLGGAAPSAYRAKMSDAHVEEILRHALCDETLFSDDFDTFVARRVGILFAKVWNRIGGGPNERVDRMAKDGVPEGVEITATLTPGSTDRP